MGPRGSGFDGGLRVAVGTSPVDDTWALGIRRALVAGDVGGDDAAAATAERVVAARRTGFGGRVTPGAEGAEGVVLGPIGADLIDARLFGRRRCEAARRHH